MPTPGAYIIFDVGKTQKKLLVFDSDNRLIAEEVTRFTPIIDEDEYEADDIDLIAGWVQQKLAERIQDPSLKVLGVNFTSYGASCVFVDGAFKRLTPLYNYLKPARVDTLASFYGMFGGANDFARETSSPAMGMLNTGYQLYRLKKERPDIFSRVKYAVHLPQYLSALVSGKYFSDLSSIGCHTGLWDFRQKQYHLWIFEEAIRDLLPPVTMDPIACSKDGITVGVGLHDSSSALLPFLHVHEAPFIFISTGTWAITFNAFDDTPLTDDDLANDVLLYMLPDGKPVKASRCLLGKVHDENCERIISTFGMKTGFYNNIPWDEDLYTRIGTPQTVGVWEKCDTGYEAYYVMMDTLVSQLMMAFQRVNSNEVETVYVDGGFARNKVFMIMLKKRLGHKKLFTASVPEATALGALIQMRKPEEGTLSFAYTISSWETPSGQG